jgi:hypothetical protein
MQKNQSERERLRGGARRALGLYASDTAYRIVLRLAVLLYITLFLLRFVLSR